MARDEDRRGRDRRGKGWITTHNDGQQRGRAGGGWQLLMSGGSTACSATGCEAAAPLVAATEGRGRDQQRSAETSWWCTLGAPIAGGAAGPSLARSRAGTVHGVGGCKGLSTGGDSGQVGCVAEHHWNLLPLWSLPRSEAVGRHRARRTPPVVRRPSTMPAGPLRSVLVEYSGKGTATGNPGSNPGGSWTRRHTACEMCELNCSAQHSWQATACDSPVACQWGEDVRLRCDSLCLYLIHARWSTPTTQTPNHRIHLARHANGTPKRAAVLRYAQTMRTMCSQRTHSTLRDKLPDKEAQTRFQSLVTINGNDGYNFELTKDLKTTIKQATDDVETYKLRDLHARGAAKGGANAAAPAAANATTTAAATAAGGNARSAACGGSAPTSGGGSSASHATLGTTERSHSQALPTQPTSGATSSTGPTVRAP